MWAPLAGHKIQELRFFTMIHLRPGPQSRVVLRRFETWHRYQVSRVINFIRHRKESVCQLAIDRGCPVPGIKGDVFEQLVALLIHSKNDALTSISIAANSSQARNNGF